MPHTRDNPIEVLLGRRPDLQHLLLSCENTNVALPYIDIVNEILEHYVVNGNLTAFTGHDTRADAATADLLADPEFVDATRPTSPRTPRCTRASLPFDMPLARTCGCCSRSGTPRSPTRSTSFGDAAGARRERLGLNAAECQILTDIGVPRPARVLRRARRRRRSTTLNDAVANAKTFCRRVGITYTELAELLQDALRQPVDRARAAARWPRRCRIEHRIAQAWFDGALDDAGLQRTCARPSSTPARTAATSLAWLTANRDAIMGLITLTDVERRGACECDFGQVELRFALPEHDDEPR